MSLGHDLDISERVEPIRDRHTSKCLDETFRDGVRVGRRDDEQVPVAFRARRGWFGESSLENRVGAPDDRALLGLPEDFVKADRRADSGCDQVAQRLAGANRRKLIDVAHERERGICRNRSQELRRESNVEHRRFVDQNEIRFERQVLVAVEVPGGWVPFEKAMNRLGLDACRLGQTLRSASCRRAQGHPSVERGMGLNDGADRRRLSGARPAGEDEKVCAE
ncbi:MAG: hypothetical protein JRF42_17755 [Deltaproteobacteria bacterium]|nr:hypothetical protein [Deltaproteobacteria bacterium]